MDAVERIDRRPSRRIETRKTLSGRTKDKMVQMQGSLLTSTK
jgi:hypothetical protein